MRKEIEFKKDKTSKVSATGNAKNICLERERVSITRKRKGLSALLAFMSQLDLSKGQLNRLFM